MPASETDGEEVRRWLYRVGRALPTGGLSLIFKRHSDDPMWDAPGGDMYVRVQQPSESGVVTLNGEDGRSDG